MSHSVVSPIIQELKWGLIQISERKEPYKDAKLWPGGSVEWDWNKTGTRHSPGVQPSDIEEILEHGVDYLVISRGMQLVLQVPKATVDYAVSKGVNVTVLGTEEARDLYNAMANEGKKVGGIFHSTC